MNEWKEEKNGKGRKEREKEKLLLVLVRQIYKIEHDKDYARTYKIILYTYKLTYSKTVKHNKSFLKALNNRTKRAKLWTWLLILP